MPGVRHRAALHRRRHRRRHPDCPLLRLVSYLARPSSGGDTTARPAPGRAAGQPLARDSPATWPRPRRVHPPLRSAAPTCDTGAVEPGLVPCGTPSPDLPACANAAALRPPSAGRLAPRGEPTVRADARRRPSDLRSSRRAEAQGPRPTAERRPRPHLADELIARPGRGDCPRRPTAAKPLPDRPAPAVPVHPPPPGRPGPAQAADCRPHRRQDLHRAGRQDVPAVDVPDPDLPGYGRVNE